MMIISFGKGAETLCTFSSVAAAKDPAIAEKMENAIDSVAKSFGLNPMFSNNQESDESNSTIQPTNININNPDIRMPSYFFPTLNSH